MPIRRLMKSISARASSPARDDGVFRELERKRRRLARSGAMVRWPVGLLRELTLSSFRLQEMSVEGAEIDAALFARADQRAMRPRQLLRIRNHIAILRWIERLARGRQPLGLEAVVRWYTSISCGLSIGSMDEARLKRLDQVLRRMNSPKLRLQQALPEIAALHVHLLADPLFPGFNGLLSRLLLQYHLARCKLPPVIFDPQSDPPVVASEALFLARLGELLLGSYDRLMEGR
jgi:hypothetical protein